MKAGQRLWTRDELVLAVNLYCKLTFGKMHQGNPDIIRLAAIIGRTPGSVSRKLTNFASLDPSLHARQIKGSTNRGTLDAQIWDEFYDRWEDVAFESEALLAKYTGVTVEAIALSPAEQSEETFVLVEGKERERLVKIRVNQSFFRKTVLAAYNNTCCITGLRQPQLLVAGHILRWSDSAENRMNPRNGLALTPLFDRAFELGYVTITPDYLVKVASEFRKKRPDPAAVEYQLLSYDQQKIRLPGKFLPDPVFLQQHNDTRFRG